jgi:hypothetical protein
VVIDVDRGEAAEPLHDPVVLAGARADDQHRMAAAEALGIKVRVIVGERVALQTSWLGRSGEAGDFD